jgi:ABC-type amino acid transport substrate-binding protein
MRERGHLVACVPRVPGAWVARQARTKIWSGVDVEMMEMLASRLRVGLLWLPVSTSDLPSALATGACDLGVGGWTSAAAQRAGLPTTRALGQVDACAITSRRPGRQRTWTELVATAHKAAALGVSGFAQALRSQVRQGQVIESDDLPLLLQHLHADRVDAVVMDRASAEHLAVGDSAVVLVCPLAPFQVQTLSYVLPRDDGPWWMLVDDFVRLSQDDGTMARLAQRYRPRRNGPQP